MKKVIFIIIFILAFGLFLIRPTIAATIISPLLELESESGETQTGVVKIFNETEDDLFLQSSVEAFTAGDETGQPAYLALAQKNSFLDWFNIEQDSILLKPKQVAIVPFELDVPADATPGGYYAVVFWETVSTPSQEIPVSVSSKVGTLIFLKVKGEIQEQGGIKEFTTRPAGGCFFNLPLSFVVRFANTGNIHLQPAGKIELKNWVGQTEVFEINSAQRHVLPKSMRRFEVLWGQASADDNLWQRFIAGFKNELDCLAWGRYTAVLNLNYGTESPQNIISQLSFWFIPWRFLIIFVLVILVLIFFIRLNSKINKLKRKKQS